MALRKTVNTLLLLFLPFVISIGQSGMEYEAIRINSSLPIITNNLFSYEGAREEGENINGPCLIRIPDWISPENRANPEAKYYLYFAHHGGEYIRMAWATEITGHWHLYNIGSGIEVGNRGVLDLGNDEIHLENGITIPNNHLASPDVHVDHENQRITLYFHSGSSTYVNDVQVNKQLTYVSTSNYGLSFYDNIEPVILGTSYFRVFEYDNELYSLVNDGTPNQAPDIESPWTAPSNFNFTNSLWKSHPENPFQLDINNDGYTKDILRVRHTGVRLVGDELHVFYSRRGDSPERIQMSTIDLSVGDWKEWDATYPPIEILQAIPGWEGGEIKAEPSEIGSAPENVNQLRDPYVFEDIDSSLYLIYTGRGEDALGIAALFYYNGLPKGFDITDLEDNVYIGSNDDEPWISETEGSGSPPNEGVGNVFDNDILTKYMVRSMVSWIEIETKWISTITGYALTFANENPERDPKSWELYGWNESIQQWESLHFALDHPARIQKFMKKSWTFENEKSYSKYRIIFAGLDDDAQGLMQLGELQIFGEINASLTVQELSNLKIYPNPTKGVINIFNSTSKEFSYEIYSVNGKLISKKQNLSGSQVRLDLSGLSRGMYVIKINRDEVAVRHKIILY